MRTFLSFLLILGNTIFLSAQKTLSLDESIRIALHNNSTLKKTENNLDTYHSNVKAAYGAFLPSLGASGSWGWTRSESPGGQTYVYQGTTFPSAPETKETRNYSIRADASLDLFNGLSNLANLSQAKNDQESAELSFERLKQDIVFNTINLYYNIINNQQLLKVKEEDVIWNQRNLETIIERNKLGAVTLADVYAQQVRFGNAELEVVRTRNLLESSKSELLDYLSLDVLDEYQFSDSLSDQELSRLEENLSEEYENLSQIVNEALNNRPDYKSVQLDLESANDGITKAWSGYLPTLTGSAGFSTYVNRVNELFKSRNYSLGLTLNIPIFSGFSTENQVQFAKVNAMNKEIAVSELERQIKKNLKSTFLDMQAAQKAVEVGKRNVVAAEENRKIESEKYSLGAGTLLNVLVANSEFTNAQTNYINAQFAYIVLSEQLKYYLGVIEYKEFESFK
jgi:outer membrane protein